MPSPFKTTEALEIVPKMVRAAARVVRSSLSQVLKNDCMKPKPGVESLRIFWSEVDVPAAAVASATVEAMIVKLKTTTWRLGYSRGRSGGAVLGKDFVSQQ
jgi:hypothetical protein